VIELLRARVAELAALDPRRKLFGSSTHNYRFNEPLPESQLAAFEREHNFRLPDDYRSFITRIGNGGAGPSYGLLPFLGNSDDDLTDYARLGNPFAYTDAHNPEHLLYPFDEPYEDGEEDDYDEADEDALGEAQQVYWDAFDFGGALFICHHGCARRSILVVSGPSRGQIWDAGLADNDGVAPELDKETGVRLTFTSWYMAWLDNAFRELGAP
jgi:hypothetical protein